MFIIGFLRGFFSVRSHRWREAVAVGIRLSANALGIWRGLIVTDESKSLLGQVWEVLSRLTWQLPQTLLGFLISHLANLMEGLGFHGRGISHISYSHGATAVAHKGRCWGAVALGCYINGDCRLNAVPHNWLFQHEYGHYLQSQAAGLFFLQRYGIPSALNCLGRKPHDLHPVEQDANIRAIVYFSNLSEPRFEWNFYQNPIQDFFVNLPIGDTANLAVLRAARLRPAWYDYLLLPLLPFVGLLNWKRMEKYPGDR